MRNLGAVAHFAQLVAAYQPGMQLDTIGRLGDAARCRHVLHHSIVQCWHQILHGLSPSSGQCH